MFFWQSTNTSRKNEFSSPTRAYIQQLRQSQRPVQTLGWRTTLIESYIYIKRKAILQKKVLLLGVHIRPKFEIQALFNHLRTFQLKKLASKTQLEARMFT